MITVSNVVNASKGELLCITYELLLEQIEKMSACENKIDRRPYIDKAVEILKMLVGDLDFEYEISKDLFRIYVYVQGLLLTKGDKEAFEEAHRLVSKIYNAYKEIVDKEENKKAVMENAEVVYAGLTYGKNSINEMSIKDYNRGFKA